MFFHCHVTIVFGGVANHIQRVVERGLYDGAGLPACKQADAVSFSVVSTACEKVEKWWGCGEDYDWDEDVYPL